MPIATTAPLPRAGDLLAGLAGAVWDAAGETPSPALPWQGEGDAAYWFSRASWALRAVVDGYRAAYGRTPCLWVPDYFCAQALEPVRHASVRLVFYPIGEDLSPQWEKCDALADTAAPDLFVQVHYFGYPADIGAARDFCIRYEAVLISDAAHILLPDESIRRSGDFVLYSLYKHFPVPDGGLLIVAEPDSAISRAVAAAAAGLARTAPGTACWYAKRSLQRIAPAIARLLQRPAPLGFTDDPAAATIPEDAALSRPARRMISRLAGSVAELARRRRENDRAVRKALRAANGLRPLLSEPAETVAPYRTVFRADDPETAADWYDRLRRTGNAVETWPDLAAEVRTAPDRHEAALALRRSTFALPIHADRTPAELATAYGAAV